MLSRKIPDAPSSNYRSLSLSLSSSSSLSLSCQKWCVNDSSAVFWRHWIQKWHHLLSDWLTRSPIELPWTAKNMIVCEFFVGHPWESKQFVLSSSLNEKMPQSRILPILPNLKEKRLNFLQFVIFVVWPTEWLDKMDFKKLLKNGLKQHFTFGPL